jgi:hypothetical protein
MGARSLAMGYTEVDVMVTLATSIDWLDIDTKGEHVWLLGAPQ